MSADLLAAFGLDKPPEKASESTTLETPIITQLANIPSVSSEPDNTWQPWPTSLQDERDLARTSGAPLWRRDDLGNEVLFDASVDDEFGDFEGPVSLPPAKAQTDDLLSLDEIDTQVPSLSQRTAHGSVPQHLPASQNAFLDIWADFEDEPVETPTSKPLPTADTQVHTRDRPTNIPPPAVLLAWLPKCYSKLSLDAPLHPSDHTVHTLIRQAFHTSAHIIAGKAQRWKRDTRLAQSMKMGAAGRPGAMKLTSVDKSEARKEDQEVEEVIAAWSRALPVLNPIMTKSSSAQSIRPIRAKMPVNTATGPEVLTADIACALCGLKRNERVSGLDKDVADLFSEWWIEHWGHHDCREFWYHFHDLLERR